MGLSADLAHLVSRIPWQAQDDDHSAVSTSPRSPFLPPASGGGSYSTPCQLPSGSRIRAQAPRRFGGPRLDRLHGQEMDPGSKRSRMTSSPGSKSIGFRALLRRTLLGEETGPNKLYDLKSDIDFNGVYNHEQVDEFVRLF